jgi:hypothetical protein
MVEAGLFLCPRFVVFFIKRYNIGTLLRCEVHFMATIVKTKSGSWKAIIRVTGNPLVTKTYRIKRDATDWARTAEDEIVRGTFQEVIQKKQPSLMLLSVI